MKGFKIMTAWIMNYGPSSLDNKPLQFMAFWNCSYSVAVLIVNIWNFEWELIFWKYLLQKAFLVKILKITPVVEC